MSRKARISSEERLNWTRVRSWTAQKGYAPYKPTNNWLHHAIVILEHQCPNETEHQAINDMSSMIQKLLFNNDDNNNGKEQLVICVEFSGLLGIRYEDDDNNEDKTNVSFSVKYSSFFFSYFTLTISPVFFVSASSF